MIITDAGDYLRVGKVSINKRKIKLIRSQGSNVMIDISGPMRGFYPGNTIAIDYTTVTEPVFNSAEELKEYVLTLLGANVNPLPLDFAMNITSRSGLSLIDELGNNASILLPVAKFNGTNNYLQAPPTGITGGQPWDITIRFKVTNTASNSCLLHCGGYSGSTRGLLIRVNAGAINVLTANGTSSVSATFAHTLANNTWTSVRLQWDGLTNGTMTTTINGVSLTSTTTIQWAGVASTNIQIGRYSAFYMAGSISELIGTFGGLPMTMYLSGRSTLEYDISSLKQFTWYGDAGYSAYDSGSTAWLDNGFSIFKNSSNNYQYVAWLPDGENLGVIGALASSYPKIKDVEPSTFHNLIDSYIAFTPNFFDRSNTTIWNATCRASAKYLAGSPKQFHITELNLLTLQSYLNDGYRGMLYTIFAGFSGDNRDSFNGVMLYDSDYKGLDQLLILRYTGDIARANKALDNTYDLDSDGYIKTYLYGELGYQSDAIANFTALQAAINAGSTTIGDDKYQVRVISQPLIIPSNRTLTVNCELRIKNGTIVNLTSNVSIGDTVINVDSVEGFAIGEWIAISDNLLPLQGGTVQTRRVAAGGRITEIGATTITIHSGSVYAVSAASGGKLGHLQSTVIVNGSNNVNITGSGTINNNRYYQYDVEPVNTAAWEEVLQGCSASIYNSNFVKVYGTESAPFNFRDSVLHNIALQGNAGRTSGEDCEIGYVVCDNAHDKNIVCIRTRRANVHDAITKNATFEDGVIFYLENNDFTISNIISLRNARGGVSIGANNDCNASVSNITTDGGMSVRSNGVTLANINLLKNSRINIDDYYGGGNNLIFNNISFNKTWNNSVGIIIIRGNVANIAFNNLTIDKCRTEVAAFLIDNNAGAFYPQNVVFNGGGITNHVGTKFNIHASADVSFIDFVGYP